ncbi:hypothetical protein [Persicobacter diffluens]
MTILENILDLRQEDWDYYASVDGKYLENPFSSYIPHREFIERFFERAGKEGVLRSINPQLSPQNGDIEHTNSIFFLGILLAKTWRNDSSSFFIGESPLGYQIFPFLWFLICLTHDLTTDVENEDQLLESIRDIETLKQHLKCRRILPLKDINSVPDVLLNAIPHYLNWKLNNPPKGLEKHVDHGIYAGFKMYDKLVKNREYRQRRIREKKEKKSLFWQKELNEQYAKASQVVATHNIWFNNPDYNKENGLDDLNKQENVRFDDYPLYVLFCIVDTIDPVKNVWRNYQGAKMPHSEKILKGIAINVGERSLTMQNKDLTEADFNRIRLATASLPSWLAVSVHLDNASIKINILTK